MNAPSISYTGPTIDSSVPFEVRRHLQLLYRKLGNHTQAFQLQQAKLDTLQSGTATTIIEGGGGGGSITPATPGGIPVNNQSGQTAYTTASTDDGALIILSDASAIALSLTSQSPPWSCFITNQSALGGGTATLTPASGTINGAATLAVLPSYSVIVVFDGTNWWAFTLPIVPINTPAVAHEWIASYNAATGTFTLSQPTASDLSNGVTGTGAVVLAVSPALTGTPTSPTASPLTNDTQIATTAYADAAVAVEKTRAQAAEALLAPIASPTFTGTVTQPTPDVLTGATTATTATAGAASALPATPTGYLEVTINGTNYKIPFYSM